MIGWLNITIVGCLHLPLSYMILGSNPLIYFLLLRFINVYFVKYWHGIQSLRTIERHIRYFPAVEKECKILPKQSLIFKLGYMIWTEKNSGLTS